MSNTPPKHLIRKPIELIPDDDFDAGELLYRRSSGGGTKSHFSKISTKNFAPGISVNRSKYANPFDVLWVANDGNCNFELKEEFVLFSSVEDVTHLIGDIQVYCKHTPTVCNFSHVDISFLPALILYDNNDKPILDKRNKTTYAAGITKSMVTTIRLFLASIFKEYEDIKT